MGDDFDGLSDDALLSYLADAALEGDMRLVIEERNGVWFAEPRSPSGLGGEMVSSGQTHPPVAGRCSGLRDCSPAAAERKAN